MNGELLNLLDESRRREKEQTLFYRGLAVLAEETGEEATAERLNGLHADEQHHLARLTARVLELDGEATRYAGSAELSDSLDGWEKLARAREAEEVAWYRKVLEAQMDDGTRMLMEEILESEVHHARELRGKWVSA